MTKTNTFETLMSETLSTEPLFKGKPVYERVTLEQVRDDVITRAKHTLEVIQAYEGGPLKAPMARSKLNAIAIKIGYGAKNEALIDLGTDRNGKKLKYKRANGLTVEERKRTAIEFFESLIPLIEEGALDDAIEAKLASFRARGVKATAARKAAKAENTQTNCGEAHKMQALKVV